VCRTRRNDMSKPFDATLKQLIRHHQSDWLGLIGVVPTTKPKWVDAELSTVTASADALIQVGDTVYHFEFETGPDESLSRRVLLYNSLAHYRTNLTVRSTAVLLRSNAQHGTGDGTVGYGDLTFGFDIVRVWQRPADEFLNASLGLLPLAVLGHPPKGRTREKTLPDLVDRIIDRAVSEGGKLGREVVTASFILAGMHGDSEFLKAIFHRGVTMIESSAFQVIEEWAKERYARESLLDQGREKFGEPTDAQAARLAAIADLPRLKRLAVRLIRVDSWDALLKGR
jgi:hypothetical protein